MDETDVDVHVNCIVWNPLTAAEKGSDHGSARNAEEL